MADLLAADVAAVAAGLGSRLREAGVPASPERAARFAATIDLAHPRTTSQLYWLARVTFVDGHDQLEAFDRVFTLVFGGIGDVAEHRGDPEAAQLPPHVRPGPRHPPGEGARTGDSPAPAPSATSGAAAAEDDTSRVMMTASVEERLRRKDFAAYTDEELALLRHLLSAFEIVAPVRRARRTAVASAGRRLDVRRTLRRAHRTGGDPVRHQFRRRRDRTRQIVLIADVSGSMEAYSRIYLHLLRGAVRGAGAEAFVTATRLTRLTRALSTGDPDAALARAADEAPDWSGGTRLGAALKTFLDDYGRRGMARGAVVVIVSDGWERADPSLLGEQMARLSRLAHRVIWVNPRSAAERFEPLAGGMAAALPYIDVLVSGHSLDALDEVVAAIGRASYRRGPTVRRAGCAGGRR